jgi:hypothetical protein
VLVRTDLPVPQQLVQAVHAAYEAGKHLAGDGSEIDSAVVCNVRNEEELLKAEHRLHLDGIRTVLFREPDIGDEATALATEPLDPSRRRPLSRYQLWEG